MKRLFITSFVVLFTLGISAQENMEAFSHLSVGVEAGLHGFGIEAAMPVHKSLVVKAGVNFLPGDLFSTDLSLDTEELKNAQEDFDIRKYNEAYYEVYGLKIKDEDIELYDRIMTVMFVNHQLNSYEYYMTSNNREKALDSLLKGLQRYEKYLQLAQILNITDDLNYVKSEILHELDKEFNMTEEEAYGLVKVDDSVDYSEYIYSLLGEYEELDLLEES